MIVIIDNYDSFTYNLYQQIISLGHKCEVFKNDEISPQKITAEKIILSPGPGRPEESGISREVLERFYKTTPILGVCLGHQLIGEHFGSKTIQAKEILHGKTSTVKHTKTEIFTEVKNPFEAARYHSLAIDKLPKDFKLLAHTEDGEIMGMKHEKYPLYGIQFHPESFLTEQGNKIMQNFLNV